MAGATVLLDSTSPGQENVTEQTEDLGEDIETPFTKDEEAMLHANIYASGGTEITVEDSTDHALCIGGAVAAAICSTEVVVEDTSIKKEPF